MAADYYPSEEYYVGDGLTIGICQCASVIALGSQVALSTATAGVIKVTAPAAFGDSVGKALAAGNTGDMVPVVFYGLCKFTCVGAITIGDIVFGGTTAGVVIPMLTMLTADCWAAFRALNNTGTMMRLGLATQDGADGSEILILVGKLY